MKPDRLRLASVVLLLSGALTGHAWAQGPPAELILLDEVEQMDFDRPESWALKYFSSVSLMSGLGTPARTESGSIELSFEGAWVPSLSEEEQRVGFIGSKVEDLNRTSFFGRLRATLGLPHDFSLTFGYTPPLETNGVEPEMFNLAIARPILDTRSWLLGLRLHGQLGTIAGDLTCPADIAGPEDPDLNPDACHEPSRDEVTADYIGLELSATPKIWGERWQPHFAISANYLDLEFQVNARYSIFDDRTLLLTDGMTYALTAGLGYRFGDRLRLTGELFYTPLDVVRDPERSAQNDELFNARALLAYRLR